MTRRFFVVLGLALAVVACGTGERSTTGAALDTSQPSLQGTITVSAAASLTEAFEAIGEDFEAAHPGASVELNLDSSTTLAQQIIDGAPADAFASADQDNMAKLVDAGKVEGEPVVIATNSLAIVVRPGNPADVRTLADLAGVGVVALCGETVPCGRFAQESLDAAGVVLPVERITRAQNVKAAVAAVAEGDAEAGIVYLTDVAGAGGSVEGVTIPDAQNIVATYSIAVITETADAALAQAFVDHVAGPGQARLREYGFAAP